MGKATKWFRNLLGFKKSHPPPPVSEAPPLHRDKRRWSFVKSYREKENVATSVAANSSSHEGKLNREPVDASATDADPNKHAIAAAAKAAETVVRLTSSSGRRAPTRNYTGSCGVDELAAVVKIQSAFRGYLARRALRALKGLVRLQALVRGHIERKRTAQWLGQMQALLRAQARARAGRVQISESSHSQSSSKTSHLHNPVKGPPTPEKFEQVIRSKSRKYEQTSMLKRNGSKSNGRNAGYGNDEKDYKTLEIDTMNPNTRSKHRSLFYSTHLAYASDNYSYSKESNHTIPSLSSGEVQSLTPLKFPRDDDECSFTTAENSPQFYSASFRGGSSKRSPFTSAKSDGSRSYLSGYSDNPSYMAYTESSRAKVRSASAPKQWPLYEKSSSARRSSLQANFASKAYLGSGLRQAWNANWTKILTESHSKFL